jgi:hypothetical protein
VTSTCWWWAPQATSASAWLSARACVCWCSRCSVHAGCATPHARRQQPAAGVAMRVSGAPHAPAMPPSTHTTHTTHHAPRTTRHAPRATRHAPRATRHAPRATRHARPRFVTKELISRGFNVTALAREKAGIKGKMGREDTIKVCVCMCDAFALCLWCVWDCLCDCTSLTVCDASHCAQCCHHGRGPPAAVAAPSQRRYSRSARRTTKHTHMHTHMHTHTHTHMHTRTHTCTHAPQEFPGATVVFGDVASPASIRAAAFAGGSRGYDVVVSCLASRTGGKKDSWAIDYQVCVIEHGWHPRCRAVRCCLLRCVQPRCRRLRRRSASRV